MSAPLRIFLDDSDQVASLLSDQSICSIIGPTGSGKTKLALELADQIGRDRTLLVSVDSVALYADLNIGSAKPTGSERNDYEWAGLDLLDLDQVATSSHFVESTLPLINRALADQKRIILVGGSHFYEQALCVGRMPGDASDPAYQASLADESNDNLHARLLAIDPRFGQKIHPADRYRITRYLDLAERQGLSAEDLSTPKDARPWSKIYTIATECDDDLAERTSALRARIESMLQAGWVDEVTQLLTKNVEANCAGLQTIGYREIVTYLGGAISLAEMKERVVLTHRQLAKAQRTWVRGLKKKSEIHI